MGDPRGGVQGAEGRGCCRGGAVAVLLRGRRRPENECDRRMREAVASALEAVGKLLVVMQGDCASTTSRMAGELLRAVRMERLPAVSLIWTRGVGVEGTEGRGSGGEGFVPSPWRSP